MRLLERDIERTCTEFLSLDGWRCLKTDPVSDRSRGKGFGEKGMADCLYIRYLSACEGKGCSDGAECPVRSEVMWCEWKRERGGKITSRAEKAKIHQKAWHAAERARGALTLIAGEDFPATIEGFQQWYMKSGLARKVHPK